MATRAAAVLLAWLLCLGPALAADAEPNDRPVLQVPLTDSIPVIDGKLDEPGWQTAARTGPLKTASGEPGKSATEAFILRDADHLYVGLHCTGKAVSAEQGQAAKGATTADVLELLINSSGDRNSYYRIQITPAGGGQVTSSYNEYDPPWHDRTWQPAFKSVVVNRPDAWTAELVLPFIIFCKNKTLASEIGFNVRRFGARGGEVHGWHGASPDPGAWGRLTGLPVRESLPPPEYGARGLNRFFRLPNKAQTSFLAEEARRIVKLGPGSAHPSTTGEVKLELEGFLLMGDPHARGIIWDLAVDESKGELYVLADTRPVRGVAEVRVFDRRGGYLRTIMPFNPNRSRTSVQDLCANVAREGETELVIPKLFVPWGEPSLYGDWWHHPQKMVLAPNGDLIMSNIHRGTLWRIKPDGSLPTEGWTSIYHRGRNEPFESTVWTQDMWHVPDLKKYLPFHALRYPYFCFDRSGVLHVSAGQSSRPTRQYAYHFEVGENEVTYHREMTGGQERGKSVWKCQVQAGPKLHVHGSFTGFAEPSGLVWDGTHLIVADAGNNRLQVIGQDGQAVASITEYQHEGQQYPLHGPTALAIDHERCLYVLVGPEPRPADQRVERSLTAVQQDVHAAALKGPDKPRTLIKLKSWQQPERLAISRPLDPDVLQIAVDGGASPPLVWVANGAGWGSLLQLAGDDLSAKAEWADMGETLSCPRQSGGQPILNIDPQTGHLYVEDDSDYRLKQYGTVYRIDQAGNLLNKWSPLFFNTQGLRATSPWWTLDYERHFRYPDEPLFIDSIFGQDERIYRWKLGKTGAEILRFDRAGKPLPFPASGTNALFVDPTMQVNFWHDVYHGMDVDRTGNIYYVAKVDVDSKQRPVSAYEALRRQVNVYDADGNLQKRSLLRLDCVRGIQVDKTRNLYALHRPANRPWEDCLALSKFASSGGEPLWSRPWDGYFGWAQVANPPCHCTAFRLHQVLDGKGYLYAAGKYSVQVIDCQTGKLVGEFGSYGNLDCRGTGSKFPHPELPFGTIAALSVWRDRLFVVDVLNRRIVKCRIVYGEGK
jgi:hypothetical protein